MTNGMSRRSPSQKTTVKHKLFISFGFILPEGKEENKLFATEKRKILPQPVR